MKRWNQFLRLALLVLVVTSLVLGAAPPARSRAAAMPGRTAAQSEPEPLYDDFVLQWAQTTEGEQRTVLLSWREPPQPRHRIFLPLVVRNNQGSPAAASSQPLVGSTIPHLAGQSAPAPEAYELYRRAVGEANWMQIGSARPAADAGQMEAILGGDLMEQLSWDLAGQGAAEPLTPEELLAELLSGSPEVRLMSEQFHEVGQVRGTAYLDKTAPPGENLEYYVAKEGGTGPLYAPSRIRAGAGPSGPSILREVWPGPEGLGTPGSARPHDAEERFHWDYVQQYRSWDGAIYLIWDTPTGEPGRDGQIIDDEKGAVDQGYYVYRAAPSSNDWIRVNPLKEGCRFPDADYCVIPIRPSAIPTESPTSALEEPYYFKENLKEKYPGDPDQIYAAWQYKVCTVDGLRQEHCSAPIVAYGRDLHSPGVVQGVQVAEPDAGPIELTWTYSATAEINQPLRFYVTRSPTLTVPLEDWEPVRPQGSRDPFIEMEVRETVSISITDSPPVGIPYWYRVQVRDDAGNWTPVSAPVLGALYPRTPPPFDAIHYNPEDCSANAMPLRLSGLDPRVLVIAVYRSFDPGGPWQLIDKVPVRGGGVQINDDYLPPYPLDVYYRLEAWDGHGNASKMRSYCARLNPDTVPPPPTGVTYDAGCDGDVCDASITWTSSFRGTQVQITQAGVDGNETTTDSTQGNSYELDMTSGAWLAVTLSGENENGAGEGVTTYIHENNNFLNTDRQMTELGPIHELSWMTGTVPSPVVELNLTGMCDPLACDPAPLVSIFRRIPSGNWMQVSTVQRVDQAIGDIHAPWFVTDTSLLMPHQTYEYVVLAHSPTSYEVLGYWGPNTLAPLVPDPEPAVFASPLEPAPQWPSDRCDGRSASPAELGMPDLINLYQGWTLSVAKYTLYDPPGEPDPTCPPTVADAGHLSGLGTLSNGSRTWPNVSFFDISVDLGSSTHTGGRIVVPLDIGITGVPTRFDARFGNIEFEASWSRVEVTMTLPVNISLRAPGDRDYSNRVFGLFGNVQTDLTGSGWSVGGGPGSGVSLADENLPWVLSIEDAWFTYHSVGLDEGASASTSYRLTYREPEINHPARPDNNLAFLRPSYSTTDFYVDPDGLQGTFSTSTPILYSTSLPAAVVVDARDGAEVTIGNSAIRSGILLRALARLDYFDRGKITDYMGRNFYCGSEPRQIALCQGWLTQDEPGSSFRTLILSPEGEDIAIQGQGLLLAHGGLSQTVIWPSFEVRDTRATLLVAAAAFRDAPPAENAWRQLNDTNPPYDDYDPGINLNFNRGRVSYSCFDPGALEDVALDLYVRRGGVSEYLLFEGGPSGWHNSRGYEETLELLELVFVDNYPVPPLRGYETVLYLPYPSDVTLPLTVKALDPDTNCALSGDIDPLAQVQHQYWRLDWTPSDFHYTSELDKYNGALGDQRELLALAGQATFTGLNHQSTAQASAPVDLPVVSEWLPNGDIGDLTLNSPGMPPAGYRVSGVHYSLTDIILSSYYSKPMDVNSLPDTLGLDLDYNMVEVPAELLDNGELTPQSLKKCSESIRVGCGFVVFDGEGAVQFFGGIEADSAGARSMPGLPYTPPIGGFPIVTNDVVSATIALVLYGPKVHWIWPVLNDTLDFPIPLKFLGNTDGGALAMVLKDAQLFPSPLPSLLHTDLGLAITFDWNASDGYFDKIGIQLGYAASQAAFRALAMNRPRTDKPGTLPHQPWSEVEADIVTWADKFGYGLGPGEEDDPVDLAKLIWDDWGDQEFDQAFNILEPYLDARNGSDAYGVTGIEPQVGDVLDWANVALNTGMAQLVYVQTSPTNGYIDMLRFGGEFRAQFDLGTYLDPLLGVDWLSVLEYNRDGEFRIHGQDLQIYMLDEFHPFADFDFLIGTSEGNQRVEGGIDFRELEIPSLFSLDLSGVFGSGQYEYEPIFFIGVTLDTGWTMEDEQGSALPDLQIGVSVLAGTLPRESEIIRLYGYGDVLDKFATESISGAPSTFSGFYAAIYIDDWHPVYDSCLLDVGAGGELRVWYFTASGGQEIWGGQLSAHIFAEIACLVSARGQLSLTFEQILGQGTTSPPPGETSGWKLWSRTCPAPVSDTCLAFTGTFWAAAGVGWCEPNTWKSWSSRWWGDSWCYTFGAIAGISYLDPASGDAWDWDYDVDFE